MDRNPRVLVRILAVLCGDCVLLHRHWLSRPNNAFLENDGGIAEDEVDGAEDVAFAEELALRVDVKGVLVAYDAAVVDHRSVGSYTECHSLMLLWPRGVLYCHLFHYEPCPCRRCRFIAR
ncbi:hypothetical protein M5K25_026169 [Dendrobium thyrsiflorum]|uniref:Secreted protein n=1 Tax=Dendrobium thyrsiflorum TaxID=117978 RepID=A0ABD0TWX4_DENTH